LKPKKSEKGPPLAPPRVLDLPADLPALVPPPEFLDQARALGIEFEPGDVPRLGRYLALLLRANETMNLTAIRDPAEAWTKHILDALALLPLLAPLGELDESHPSEGPLTLPRVIDVGSGGGVPGVPLAICLPNFEFVLLESTGKKAEFLRAVVDRLALANTRVIAGRAERLGHVRAKAHEVMGPEVHREAYDAVLARAVGKVNLLVELCVPFAKVGGHALLVKGRKADEELAEAARALKALHAAHTQTLETPTGKILVIEKLKPTPRMYPRPDGEPAKDPL
jgi:16S rRNA (guanine527-N7)-methyltransferase